jgi:dihydroorotase
LVHGEVTDAEVDIFDRERVFIDQKLRVIQQNFPALRIVLEHVTTREAVQFVQETPSNIGATITPQHLLYNRNAILVGGIKPHYYCLPILKRETHRLALVAAATSGNPKFFLGTDSAPHMKHLKENSCGCAGCYSAYGAIELYAEAFEQANALDKLEGFASFFGADFYQLPRNTKKITLEKTDWQVPSSYSISKDLQLTPLRAGETLHWKLKD